MNYCAALLIPGKGVGLLVVTNQGGESATKGCQEARNEIVKKMLK